jgi:putative DNA primase/helicase
MLTEAFVERLEGVRAAPGGYQATCPAHDDRIASLSIRDGGDKTLIHCHAMCSTSDVLEAMGLQWTDLWHNGNGKTSSFSARKPDATYIYEDERGSELYRVIRYSPKDFRQVRRTVPYRLRAVIEAVKEGRTVYIVEGEKDVHALEAAGRIATCNAGGAGSWKPEYAQYFKGAKVIVVADNDEPGMRHAKDVAANLEAVASRVWIVRPMNNCKDISDHLGAGFRVEGLITLEHVR